VFAAILLAQTQYYPPAGMRPALSRPGPSILPGGRVIAPLGDEFSIGYGAFGLALSQSGRVVVTANSGPDTNSLTILERDRSGKWDLRHVRAGARPADSSGLVEPVEPESGDWRGVFMGLAFANEHSVYVSEGNTGRITQLDWNSDHRRVIDLNRDEFDDSYSGDLALDSERGILYAVDQANFRVAVIDVRSRKTLSSIRVGRLPFALALAPDRQQLYVSNVGMFEYKPIPGADPKRARDTGLPFPAFGFPSPEAERGTGSAPGLGDPNVRESNSVAVVDVSTPAVAKVVTFIRTGVPFGDQSQAGSSPSGILAAGGRVFVSNASNDSITVIDPKTNRVEREIPIRIPGLENLRGTLPIGMAWHETNGWLLVAEAGINAIGVIDVRHQRVLGHIPAGWFPTRVAISGDTVYVATARGHGRGPNAPGAPRQGSLATFPLPSAADLAAHTAMVMQVNGFVSHAQPARPVPPAVRHVVLIVKENRTYDEVLGDAGSPAGVPVLARLGERAYVDGHGKRFSFKDVNLTPNHHAVARRWASSDNFYADSDVSVDGHHWLVGAYPNAWTISSLMAAYSEQKKDFRLGAAPGRLIFAGSDSSVHPEEQIEGGTIWHHLERYRVPFYNFGEGFELAGLNEGRDLEPTGARFLTNVPMPDPLFRNTSRQYPGFNMNIPDQYRASQFIREIDEKYVKRGAEFPRFIFVHLPNDHMAKARPDDGYPYEESFVADNDYALGRIIEYLSHTKWWPQMAVFITEDDAQGGVDHVDAHRTVLLTAGPWLKKNYVSHVNTSFPGLLKTIFRVLGLPPLTLFDATAADLSDCFAATPDPAPYQALPSDKRIFDPATARQSTNGEPSPRMDAPRAR
jgi:YVTN family beta-propeller protein